MFAALKKRSKKAEPSLPTDEQMARDEQELREMGHIGGGEDE